MPHRSSQPRRAAVVAQMLLMLGIACVVSGCGNRQANQAIDNSTANAPIAQRGNWFCQPAAPGSADPWDCVQDAELAKNPRLDRLPNALGSDRPSNTQNSQPSQDRVEAIGSAPAATVTPLVGDSATNSTVTSDPTTALPTPPDYVRLAFQPDTPVAIMDLPADYYAVQLTALPNKRTLDAFANANNLSGFTAAEVASEGDTYYVLLLGIYATEAEAQQAADSRPGPMQQFDPWLRSVGNLQEAMEAAQAIHAVSGEP